MLHHDSGKRRTRDIGTVNDLFTVVDDISKSISRGLRLSGTQKQVISQVASVIKVRVHAAGSRMARKKRLTRT